MDSWVSSDCYAQLIHFMRTRFTFSRFLNQLVTEEKQTNTQLKMTAITTLAQDTCEFASFSVLDFSFLLLRLIEKQLPE